MINEICRITLANKNNKQEELLSLSKMKSVLIIGLLEYILKDKIKMVALWKKEDWDRWAYKRKAIGIKL